jgi:hypothetical protein
MTQKSSLGFRLFASVGVSMAVQVTGESAALHIIAVAKP